MCIRDRYKRFEKFLGLKDDIQLRNGNAINTNVGKIAIRNLSFQYEERKIIDGLKMCIRDRIYCIGLKVINCFGNTANRKACCNTAENE